MELVKNIFFNTDRLTPYLNVKITYTGNFFDDKSEKVFLHYGFDKDWKNMKDIEMTRSEIGFQAEVELIDTSTFNICFYNEKNEWDNNNNQNYIFKLEKPDLSLIVLDDNYSLISPRKLSRFYLWKKKIKITIYKAITYLPKLLNGKYKRKSLSQ